MCSATVTHLENHRVMSGRQVDQKRLQSLAGRFQRMVPTLLDRFFSNADDFLFKMAEKTTDGFDSNSYFEQLRSLRLQKTDITQSIVIEVKRWCAEPNKMDSQARSNKPELVAEAGLSLMDDVQLEKTLATDSFTNRSVEHAGDDWLAFHERMLVLTGEKNLSLENTPFNAEVFGRIVLTELEKLHGTFNTVLMLFRLFDDIAIKSLIDFYQRSNVWLIEEEILPNLKLQSPTRTAHQNVDAQTIAKISASLANIKGLEQGVNPAGVVTSTTAAGNNVVIDANLLSSLMSSIGQIQTQLAPSAHSLDELKQWTTAQASEVSKQTQGSLEAGTVSLVAMLFEYILDDTNLSSHMKQLLARMQIPIIKVAILDKTFFTDTDHSARLLLNRMARSANGWHPDANIEDDLLLDGMENIVTQLNHDFDDDLGIFDKLLEDFSDLVEQYQQQQTKQIESIVIQEEDSFVEHQNQDRARIFIDTLLADESLPETLHQLLDEGWYKLMKSIFAKQGEGKAWQTSGRIAKELVWSLQPSVQLTHLERFQQLVPKLLKGIENGLAVIGYDKDKISHIIENIENYHALYSEPLNEQIWEAQEKLESFERRSEDADAVIAEPVPIKIDEPVVQIKNADLSYYMDQVESLSENQWFDIEQSDGSFERGCLTCIIGQGSKYIFTDYSGNKLAERSAIGLAMSMRNDQFKLIAEDPLFDRMIDTLLDDLGQDPIRH